VGDNAMQVDLTTPRRADSSILTRLPKAWHADYLQASASSPN
jgi:hypothetical protein